MDEIIPQISSQYYKARCICKSYKRCNQVSRSFQNLKDVRGSFIQMPTMNGFQHFRNQNKIKAKRAERFCVHLQISIPIVPSESKDSKKNPQEDGVEKPKRMFVALHHFHPQILDPKNGIIKICCNGKRFKMPDDMPIKYLQYWELMEEYSSNDFWNETQSLIVPNYPISKSEKDLLRITSSVVNRGVPKHVNTSLDRPFLLSTHLKNSEVIMQEQGVNKQKANGGNDNAKRQDNIELKLVHNIHGQIQESLRRIYSRMNIMKTLYLKTNENYLSHRQISYNDLASIDSLVTQSFSEVQFIERLQGSVSDLQIIPLHNTASSSISQNNVNEASISDIVTGQYFSDTPSIDHLQDQLCDLEKSLFADSMTLNTCE